MPGPELVAHRGYMLHYPENTLCALEAAISAGAKYIEFDVHLSRDRVPVVLHDANLVRTTGREVMVYDLDALELQALVANEPVRFPGQFADAGIPLLQEVVGLLQRHPDVTAFVELKRRSLQRFGAAEMVQRVLQVLAPVLSRCVVISFDADALATAREMGAPRVGWVMEPYDDAAHARAAGLQPEFLFTDQEILPPSGKLLPGSWQWVIYDVVDADLARDLYARGAQLIETKAVGELAQSLAEVPDA